MSEPDRLERIKDKSTDYRFLPYDLCVTPNDVDWLIEEVERLRKELAPCGEVGCPHAHAVPTLRADGRSTE